jgi:hypothetical protein
MNPQGMMAKVVPIEARWLSPIITLKSDILEKAGQIVADQSPYVRKNSCYSIFFFQNRLVLPQNALILSNRYDREATSGGQRFSALNRAPLLTNNGCKPVGLIH